MRILALLAFLFTLLVNQAANRLPLNGVSTVELSERYANLFVPAGITFAIWGVIYLLLIAWVGVQFLPRFEAAGKRLAPLFALTSLLNGGWLLAWHYGYLVGSVLIMVSLLAVLVRINLMLRSGERPLLARAAFGLYLGWVLVATIANITAVLVAFGSDGLSQTAMIWAMVMVAVGGLVGSWTLLRVENAFTGAALMWAIHGVVLARRDDVPMIAIVAWTMVGIVALATVFQLSQRFRKVAPV